MAKDKTNYKDPDLLAELEKSAGSLTAGVQRQYWKKSVYPLFKEVADKMKEYRELFNRMKVMIAAGSIEFSSLGKLDEFMAGYDEKPLSILKMHFLMEQFGVGSKDKYFDLEAGLEIRFEEKGLQVCLKDHKLVMEKEYNNHLSQKEIRQIVHTYIDDIEERLDHQITSLG